MGFLLRNWHLKLAALFAATVLYTGFVYSGTLTEHQVTVPITLVNQPDDAYNLTGDLGFVVVRYRSTSESGAELPADAFIARVDLSEYDLERAPEPQALQIRVSAEGADIIPPPNPVSKRVQLDVIETKTVPIEVDTGEIPEGLEIGEPDLSETDGEVEVRGPAAEVARVEGALAPISIDPSGIDFDQPVELVPVDIEGQPLGIGRVELTPGIVSVRVEVNAVETTKTVPITPDIGGTPAAGFALDALSVNPATVTLRGLPEALTGVTEVQTEPLDLDGVTETQVFDADLVLPAGTRLARASAEPVAQVEATIVPSVSSRSFVVGVTCQGAAPNTCVPSQTQFTITVAGPGSALSGLTATAVTPVLDATGLAPGSYTLPLQVPLLPQGVELLQLQPGSVSVRIVAPSTPPPTPAP